MIVYAFLETDSVGYAIVNNLDQLSYFYSKDIHIWQLLEGLFRKLQITPVVKLYSYIASYIVSHGLPLWYNKAYYVVILFFKPCPMDLEGS